MQQHLFNKRIYLVVLLVACTVALVELNSDNSYFRSVSQDAVSKIPFVGSSKSTMREKTTKNQVTNTNNSSSNSSYINNISNVNNNSTLLNNHGLSAALKVKQVMAGERNYTLSSAPHHPHHHQAKYDSTTFIPATIPRHHQHQAGQVILDSTSFTAANNKDTAYTYLVIVKSPRSGSTFLKQVLEDNPMIFNKFEPKLYDAKRHFDACPNLGKNHGLTQWTCSVALNDYLKNNLRYSQINSLITQYKARVVVQLRANVVEKKISASKLWGGLRKGRHHNEMVLMQEIPNGALKGLDTIRGFAIADTLMPSGVDPPFWIWYEDLVRDCSGTVAELYQRVGLMNQTTPQRCNQVKFHKEPLSNEIPVRVVNKLKENPTLAPMVDRYNYDMEVDTQSIYKKHKKETENVTKVQFGFWR